MNVQVENLEKNMAKLTVTVDAAELEKAITKAYNKQKNSISVPGFRKGKVPQHMIEKMYGAEIFYEDAANIIMQDTYPAAYDESKLDIVSQPKIDITQLEKGKDFIYTAEVAVKPEVKLGKYKGVSVTKIDSKVTATEVNNTIKAELERDARMVTKTGKASKGDTATIASLTVLHSKAVRVRTMILNLVQVHSFLVSKISLSVTRLVRMLKLKLHSQRTIRQMTLLVSQQYSSATSTKLRVRMFQSLMRNMYQIIQSSKQ